MSDRAVLVGINAYADAPLSGCVNDVSDMAEFLVETMDFDPDNIRLLTDKRATREGILERLEWLVGDAKAGDRLMFHFSGHGVQMPTRNKKAEVDGLDECLCPQNFAWTDDTTIRDKDLVQVLSKLPVGVKMLFVSDSCHSGDMTRGLQPPSEGQPSRPKFIPMPADIAWRYRSLERKGLTPKPGDTSMVGKTAELPLVYISGCTARQTSADAWFKGRANGALTHHLLKMLESPHGITSSMQNVIKSVRAAIRKSGFSQTPQLEGLKAGFLKPILG